ncbi:mannose-P-dolichol utilization defect 1 protein-like [Mizuhopecten yessoensis]|uniref:Mannose-P-dolichol utilization defect 1 protein homolog n=1 Tax=Mizuhopecten yessoensis TaxID=6573 RepID=A0A210R0J8_MIZYE|nr:mannose-P-dolichol utilization defect 1 protein-like [Mizuhopecten yessoensis]XP_021344973.1 mannose-P-dolichol utilization defect 1 protein-like [Mizuhopecten yessoensis]OWF54482.1 Mannose-P-dolichol utilization defect 1 protein [Mizuhopecten yessoensis]
MAKPVTDEVSLLERTLQVFVPQPCYDEFFVNLNFLDAYCQKVVLSKCLGYGIILGAVLVKLPQILKIFKAKSAEGISFISVLFELIAVSATTTYGYAMKFPFSSYGEGIFLVLQTAAIVYLVLYYRKQQALLFLVIYTLCMAYLLSPVVSIQLLSVFQSANIVVVILSKMIQALTNFRNGGTGQLSAITVTLLFTGSLARIFTSQQETGDTLIIMSFVVSSVCNGLILAQILYYWNRKPKAD